MKQLIGLSLLILLSSSCDKFSKKTVAINETDTIKVKPVAQEIIDLSKKFYEGDVYHSHIKLDFAITDLNGIDTSEINIVRSVCALSIIPDTTWINEQQRSMPEDEWNTIVDDNQYYEYLASDTLKKLGIQTIYLPRNKKYVKFVKSNGSETGLDLNILYTAWGLILFNGNDDPVLWSSTDIDQEIKDIFNK